MVGLGLGSNANITNMVSKDTFTIIYSSSKMLSNVAVVRIRKRKKYILSSWVQE